MLQQYTGFKLDDALNETPPVEWKAGDEVMQKEKIYPLAHLTMYVKVSREGVYTICFAQNGSLNVAAERPLGQNGGAHEHLI